MLSNQIIIGDTYLHKLCLADSFNCNVVGKPEKPKTIVAVPRKFNPSGVYNKRDGGKILFSIIIPTTRDPI